MVITTRIEIPPLILRIGSSLVAHSGVPASSRGNKSLDGHARVCVVTGPGFPAIDIGLVTWSTGERELKPLGPRVPIQDYVYSTARTTLARRTWDDSAVLSMRLVALAPQVNNPQRWTAQSVTEEHLDWIVGSSFADFAASHGALAFGTGANLFGDASKDRNCLNVVFAEDNVALPFAAFAITRYLSMVKGFAKDKVGT